MKATRRLFVFVMGMFLAADGLYAQDKIVDELADIAKDYMRAKDNLQVFGFNQIDFNLGTVTNAFRNQAVREMEEIIRRKERLIERGVIYNDSKTELTVRECRIDNSTARLKANVHTKLPTNGTCSETGEPITEEYEEDHWFHFIREKNGWKLAWDEQIPVPKLRFPDTRKQKVIYLETIKDIREPPQLNMLIVPEDFDPSLLEEHPLPEAASGWLNRKAIVDYAKRYWSNYNPYYKRYFADCTNFVSQALQAGGWPFLVGNGWFDYRLDTVWWYDWLICSYTWAGAHNFFTFIQGQKRAYLAKSWKDLQPGDILQLDSDKNGNIDHSMIVTEKDTNSISLTYHTKNTLNRPIDRILEEYQPSKTNYYGWRLYDAW